MALSASYNYAATRDLILSRALRIVGHLAQGETATSTALTEASYALNDIFKEWQADGLQLWKTTTISLAATPTTGTNITISPAGAMVTLPAPKKVLSAWYKNETTLQDTPLLLITKEEYDRLTPKATTGTPNQCYYQTPRPTSGTDSTTGTFYFFPALSTAWLAANDIYASVVNPLMDFDASGDNPDIPDYLFNALTWAVADQISYEYGVGLSERSMITKKAMQHKAVALGYDQEEGSLWIRPEANYE